MPKQVGERPLHFIKPKDVPSFTSLKAPNERGGFNRLYVPALTSGRQEKQALGRERARLGAPLGETRDRSPPS